MKKLMTLMFLGLAAFAGGGMMNEHNLTTFVNYLYHKQQVGTVINLGTITDSPPAELPPTLPSTPGAVPTTMSPGAIAANPADSQIRNPEGPPPAPAAVQPAAQPQGNGSELLAKGTGNVPGSAPPPISIRWPDQTVSTFRASPNAPEAANASPAVAPPPSSLPGSMAEAMPPALPIDSRIAAVTPHVPPPPIQNEPPPRSSAPLRDEQIGRASFGGNATERPQESAPVPPSQTGPGWDDVEDRMRSLGVVRYEILGTPEGKKKFRCELAIAGAPKFEADHDDLIQAAQTALKRVVLFHGARKATGAAGRADDQPVAVPPSSLPKMNDSRKLSVPVPPAPAGPLTPPADLPN